MTESTEKKPRVRRTPAERMQALTQQAEKMKKAQIDSASRAIAAAVAELIAVREALSVLGRPEVGALVGNAITHAQQAQAKLGGGQ